MRWPLILGGLAASLLAMSLLAPSALAQSPPAPPKDVTQCAALCPDLFVPPGCVQLRTPRTCTCEIRCGWYPGPAAPPPAALTPAAPVRVWRVPAHPGPFLPFILPHRGHRR